MRMGLLPFLRGVAPQIREQAFAPGGIGMCLSVLLLTAGFSNSTATGASKGLNKGSGIRVAWMRSCR